MTTTHVGWVSGLCYMLGGTLLLHSTDQRRAQTHDPGWGSFFLLDITEIEWSERDQIACTVHAPTTYHHHLMLSPDLL